MNLYWIGLDLGNRYTKSSSDGLTVYSTKSLVAQSEEIYTLQELADDTETIGCLVQPFYYLIGNLAQLAAPEDCEMVFGNERHFLDPQFKELNPAVAALIFHAIRLHIPESVKECEVILCITVSRKEYVVNLETMQCKLANSLSQALERTWRVQLLNGKACQIHLQKVLVKPQCELAVYAKFATAVQGDGYFQFNYDLLYHHPEQVQIALEQKKDRLFLAQLKTRLAKKIIVYDIGSYSTQIERISPINGVITVTKAMSPNDIGMMMMQDHFKGLLQAKFGERKKVAELQKYQILQIFEEEEWDGVSVSDLINQTIEYFFLRYWREFSQNVKLEDADAVLLSGQSWQKKRLLELFLERVYPLAQQYGVELIYEPVSELGKFPTLGAYVLAKNWWLAYEKKKTKQNAFERALRGTR